MINRINGPVKDNEGWRIRMNNKLQQLGHLIRMDDNRLVRRMTGGGRQAERPKIKWKTM